MPHKKHIVKQGDCISNIAYQHGHFPDTIWNDSKNSDLRQKRKDPNVLLPGDVVYIRDIEAKEESCASEQRHRFKRKGIPEILKLRFLDAEDKPRKGLPYTLHIEGLEIKGTTDGDGRLEEPIPPDAKNATLTLGKDNEQEVFELNLGHLDPVSEITGVQARLNNLGYNCGDEYGEIGELTRSAISQFQQDHDIKVTGELNEETRKKIDDAHKG